MSKINLDELRLIKATQGDFPAHVGIFALCGEYMHRRLNLSHWYPFVSYDTFAERMTIPDVFGVYHQATLIGSMLVAKEPLHYYDGSVWKGMPDDVLYLHGIAILPSHQQHGIGSWCMSHYERLATERDCSLVRFDAVSNHPKLLQFYDRLGYVRQGPLQVGKFEVMCYEKAIPNEPS